MGLLNILKHYRSLAARLSIARLSLSKDSTKRTEKQKKGRMGEELTVRELKKRGFRILRRNWRFLRNEIDIIAEKEERVVFVEVKTRKKEVFFPVRSLTFDQERRIILASRAFLRELGRPHAQAAYLYSLVLTSETGPPEIHLRVFRKLRKRKTSAIIEHYENNTFE